jgi:RimJ/RimL family protein N-acetyltransferase
VAQPVLRTERLVLVPLADRHLDLEIELDSDPEVLRFLWGRARTRDEVIESHAQRLRQASKLDGLGLWVAFEHRDEPAPVPDEAPDRFVGLMMLPPAHGPDQPDDPAVADLGYRLLRRQWGLGLAREASAELLRHAFEVVGMRRVIAQTMAVNTRSRAVMEALGMRFVRRYHPVFDDPLPGRDEGDVEYALDRRDWIARHLSPA